jgi:hypothetical protein
MIGAVIAITHFPKAYDTSHVLQFAVAVGGAGETIQRVVGDVELHNPASQVGEFWRLGADFQSGFDGSRAGRRVASTALDLYETETARPERFQAVGCAEFGNSRPGCVGCVKN